MVVFPDPVPPQIPMTRRFATIIPRKIPMLEFLLSASRLDGPTNSPREISLTSSSLGRCGHRGISLLTAQKNKKRFLASLGTTRRPFSPTLERHARSPFYFLPFFFPRPFLAARSSITA